MDILEPGSHEAAKYGWLMFVALIGGLIGYFRKQAVKDKGKKMVKKLYSAFLSIITSMFVAYITYEVLFYISEVDGLSVAIAGLASFAGTDLLVAFEEGLITALLDAVGKVMGGKK